MLILHPRIYLDYRGTTTDALLIDGHHVVAIGEEARRRAGRSAEVVRPEAACVMPALGDAHIHLWGAGLRAHTIDLRGMSAAQILNELRLAAPRQDGWIVGTNWNENNFADDHPLNLALLDQLFPNQPVCLHRVDAHALWVNSEALRRAGLDELVHDLSGGLAERGPDGRLTGVLIDHAMEPVLRALPPADAAEDRLIFTHTANTLVSHGVSFSSMAFTSMERLELVDELIADGELPSRVDFWIDGTSPDIDRLLERGPRQADAAGHRVGTIKFFADGALGSAGAWLLEPYRTGGQGLQTQPVGYLKARIPELMRAGWQVAVHAIGDAAARDVLDAFEAVPPELRARLRPRLEHAQIVHPDDCPRFAELGVIASIQPIHLRSDVPWAPRRLFEPQLQRLFPWRDLLPTTLAAGSDYPIDDPNPWHGIATALTRQGYDEQSFGPEHALTRQEAIRAYTFGAAFASHREHQLGALHPGYLADVIALSADPFVDSPEAIRDIEVIWSRLPGR
ncbi:amidohydrolase [Bradymonadaceae bacterium TMQ3]|nr:amidohydrolase [Bradymonadaceae bacterium TMQ3]TXC75866.1 amidohydrolase [Bradymonadales bacterium TMQ1]